MVERSPAEVKNLDRYGNDALPWSRARDALAMSHGPEVSFFLGTVRPAGRTPPVSAPSGTTVTSTS